MLKLLDILLVFQVVRDKIEDSTDRCWEKVKQMMLSRALHVVLKEVHGQNILNTELNRQWGKGMIEVIRCNLIIACILFLVLFDGHLCAGKKSDFQMSERFMVQFHYLSENHCMYGRIFPFRISFYFLSL